ncbi:SDR family NAD(P)-dependent oxidoreductase [Leptospira gomenensis]|uniref:SDR family NAD(P)-dependent oxidoreductase n=1 Tax=Leptospira gomenensis TaxID=2484974 RepID=A0A5F1YA59_9LEPT|nr:SDR family NAD(P)-dependent oxidoreductase [Leptospira gomenensis]TGK33723.1 SDR family NAD(P)-dependent oxidoreductase [Leptospira gomenensis]TGK41966.1 SDR family NAD(P)-dependent oxidoreductase [Leptospira gomenensis]TGK44212.1 SDR family NAD(P)-dependent oxidoreductase [Leptospira gomenensis]TGK58000.1 SDR family NAD(P)-dependent oxidoreductase [Leptospira gomenensis]
MSTKNALIIGSSGVAGQSAIQAVREHSKKRNETWRIVSTTSKNVPLEEADVTIQGIDLDRTEVSLPRLYEALSSNAIDTIDLFVYTPARGNLGYPVSETPKSDLDEALKFCMDPMLSVERKLSPALSVAYSAFYYRPHLQPFYGSLAFVKKKQEEWALASPAKRKIIRAGSFFSQSVRGITILLQRMGKKSQDPDLQKLLKLQKESGQSFPDFFLQYVAEQERSSFQSRFSEIPFRLTSQDDLKEALIRILEGETAPIVSLVGPWVWTETELPPMPEYLNKY